MVAAERVPLIPVVRAGAVDRLERALGVGADHGLCLPWLSVACKANVTGLPDSCQVAQLAGCAGNAKGPGAGLPAPGAPGPDGSLPLLGAAAYQLHQAGVRPGLGQVVGAVQVGLDAAQPALGRGLALAGTGPVQVPRVGLLSGIRGAPDAAGLGAEPLQQVGLAAVVGHPGAGALLGEPAAEHAAGGVVVLLAVGEQLRHDGLEFGQRGVRAGQRGLLGRESLRVLDGQAQHLAGLLDALGKAPGVPQLDRGHRVAQREPVRVLADGTPRGDHGAVSAGTVAGVLHDQEQVLSLVDAARVDGDAARDLAGDEHLAPAAHQAGRLPGDALLAHDVHHELEAGPDVDVLVDLAHHAPELAGVAVGHDVLAGHRVPQRLAVRAGQAGDGVVGDRDGDSRHVQPAQLDHVVNIFDATGDDLAQAVPRGHRAVEAGLAAFHEVQAVLRHGQHLPVPDTRLAKGPDLPPVPALRALVAVVAEVDQLAGGDTGGEAGHLLRVGQQPGGPRTCRRRSVR